MLSTLLRFINERHGTAFEPGERFPSGEQGAYALTERSGAAARRFVLKWYPGVEVPVGLENAMATTERLCAVGYPAPRYQLVGAAPSLAVVYSVQEALPGGAWSGHLRRPLLDRLLELNTLQQGQAAAPTRDWPSAVAEPVLHGGDGYCLLDPMRSYSAATASLLSTLQRLVAEGGAARETRNDVVHLDFQGPNILVVGDEVSGVVDWEGTCAGDRAFDLATLCFYADAAESDTRDRLWHLTLMLAGPHLLGVYLAHLALRQVDWSIRFHDRSTIERWLGRAHEVLGRFLAAVDAD